MIKDMKELSSEEQFTIVSDYFSNSVIELHLELFDAITEENYRECNDIKKEIRKLVRNTSIICHLITNIKHYTLLKFFTGQVNFVYDSFKEEYKGKKTN